jgi:hypothetical protein
MSRTDEVWAELQRVTDENDQLRQIAEAAMSLEREGVFQLAQRGLLRWADGLKEADEEERLVEVVEAWKRLGEFLIWFQSQEERMSDGKEE